MHINQLIWSWWSHDILPHHPLKPILQVHILNNPIFYKNNFLSCFCSTLLYPYIYTLRNIILFLAQEQVLNNLTLSRLKHSLMNDWLTNEHMTHSGQWDLRKGSPELKGRGLKKKKYNEGTAILFLWILTHLDVTTGTVAANPHP